VLLPRRRDGSRRCGYRDQEPAAPVHAAVDRFDPWPDVNRHWGETEIKARESELTVHTNGCQFYARCPFAMDKCLTPPPLFRINARQAAACYLYDSNPSIAPEQLSEMLRCDGRGCRHRKCE